MKKRHSASKSFCAALAAVLACSNFAGMSAFAVDTAPTETALPSSFDLRNIDGLNFVTPVKNQGLTGTCWAYAAISAAETSIMYENWKINGIKPQDEMLDLSELQTAWFAFSPYAGYDAFYPEQVSEGNSALEWFNGGGGFFTAAALFFSNIGPIDDSILPFKSKTGNVIWYKMNEDYSNIAFDDDEKPIFAMQPIDWDHEGDEHWIPQGYNPYGEDFGVSELQRYLQKYKIENTRYLSSPNEIDRDDNYIAYHPENTELIKKELVDGRAVVMNYFGDNRLGNVDAYISDKFAQYCYNVEDSNHAVCVVGYDDNYSRENFNQGKTEDGVDKTPPGDGAWIVKNSWGTKDDDIPTMFGEDGCGYFYLSYYDKSISTSYTMDFDVTQVDQTKSLPPFQHDLSLPDGFNPIIAQAPMKFCNVFSSKENYILDSVSTFIMTNQADVTYEVYKLKPDAQSMDDSVLVSKLEKSYNGNMGYYREKLPQPVAISAGEQFYIAVTMKCEDPTNGTIYIAPVGVNLSDEFFKFLEEKAPEEMAALFSGKHNETIHNAGESVLFIDSDEMPQKWVDISAFDDQLTFMNDYDPSYEEMIGTKELQLEHGFIYDNFSIKGYREAGEEVSVLASLKTDKDSYAVGDTVTFTLTLTNPSKVFDLVGMEIKSRLSSYDFSKDAYLEAGKSKTITFTYTVTESDIKNGKIKDMLTLNAGQTSAKPVKFEIPTTINVNVPAETTAPAETTVPTETKATESANATTETTAKAETQTNETTTAQTTAKYSSETIAKMAAKDYQSKNYNAPVEAKAAEKNGKVVVTITDMNENVVETYTIDPQTGKGTTADGKEVDLPQTGNNSAKTAASAAVALLLTLGGAATMAKSGVFRKKEDENA